MTTNEMIQQLAEQTGVDATSVETLAKMCADRIEKWDVEVDSDTVTAAVMDSQDAYKTMTIRALSRTGFSSAIHGMLVGPQEVLA